MPPALPSTRLPRPKRRLIWSMACIGLVGICEDLQQFSGQGGHVLAFASL